jgi:hypothetical protein
LKLAVLKQADVLEEESQTVHDAQETALRHHIHALEQELHALHQSQALSEGALRKKKAKAEQEVEVDPSLGPHEKVTLGGWGWGRERKPSQVPANQAMPSVAQRLAAISGTSSR